MVQKSSEFTTQQLGQYLAQTLGQPLSEQELSNCIKLLEILQPSPGKLFWQSQDATVGIYIVLAGKVRLLDRTDNLIASLGAGASFGELTLFPGEHFQPYAARASVNLKLCCVPGDCLRSLIHKYPSIGQHLHQQAGSREQGRWGEFPPLYHHIPSTLPLLNEKTRERLRNANR